MNGALKFVAISIIPMISNIFSLSFLDLRCILLTFLNNLVIILFLF